MRVDLGAGVPFWGRAPPLEDVPNIKAPLMILSAETDPRINASWPDYEAALKAAGPRSSGGGGDEPQPGEIRAVSRRVAGQE